ncbi:MAG: O-antigen ligase family protein [Candidatus Ratteibacteria bacterium]
MAKKNFSKRQIKRIKKFEIYYFIGIIFLFFGGVLLTFHQSYDYTLIKNLMGFLFCLFISIYYLLSRNEFEFSSLLYLPIIFFTYILISSFFAPFKFESGKNLENYILYFLIFLIGTNLKIDKKIFYLWIFSGTIASIVGIFQFYGERHYAISTFGNPNFYAGHIIMVLSILLSNILNTDYKKEMFGNLLRIFDILCLIFCIWGLIVTKSRAAIMAFLVSCTFVWYFSNYEKKGFSKYIGIIMVFLILLFFIPKIIDWYKGDIRYFIWKGTWRMILKKPIFGWGFGNFIFFYPYFRVREYFLQPEATPVTNHAHNEYLEKMAEIGILGLLIYIFFLLTFIISAVKNENKKTKIFLPGILSGIISVSLDNIFSTNLTNPSTSMYFWFLIGISSQYFYKEKVDFQVSKLLWISLFASSLILAVFHSYYRILPQVYYKKGIFAKETGNYKESIKNYSIACELNPYNYECWYKLAYVYGVINKYDESKKIYLYINNYLFPHYAKTDANLGTVYLKIGDIEKGFKYYKIAEWFNPYDEDVLCSIASIYLMYYNKINEALNYLKRILKINPKNEYANRVLYLLEKEGKIKRRR